MDEAALDALGEERLDWRFKAIPPSAHGTTAAEYAAARPPLSDFGTPLLTLDAGALDHNVRVLADWTERAGVLLAPHGKTTMAPQLWRRQLDAGAWGITLANLPQLRVARAFGVRRLMLANAVTDLAGLAWLAGELDHDPHFEFVTWADSVRTVELMDQALRAARAQRVMSVCVELGGPDGRTGARDDDEAVAIADAIAKAPTLDLVGVAGYEGAFVHDATAASLETVDGYLKRLAALFDRLDYATEKPIVTAGGSAYFDQVAGVLGGLDAQVILRSGAYVIHDDGFYREISPLARGAGVALASAMHGWARVTSRPEPGLALLDAGKRDLPFDEDMPVPQLIRGKGPAERGRVTKVMDQHTFLIDSDAEIGDVVRLGLSHPCTAMDKWALIPVVDDADAPDPVVVDLIRTWFG
ncbi:alanine racemase [Actinomadura hibisca]|uniref:alanine racemase n=1 Tax=Actinomadura hibisca TaxID=68565 RepID=UPI00082A003E|nr:alanine racemase [Actinomadura hibisca]